MTSPSPASTDADRQRCMLYLLGELSETDSAAFVAELASSETLAESLCSEADLLALLGDSGDLTSDAYVAPASPATHVSVPAARPRRRPAAFFALVALAAAASVAAFVFPPLQSPRPADTPNESLLVAQAWVEGTTVDSVYLDSVLVVDADAIPRPNRHEHASVFKLNDAAEDADDNQAIPSWMLVAFENESSESTDADQEPIDG